MNNIIITATEAQALYNPNLNFRDEILKEIIEPGIMKNAPFKKEFVLSLDEWGYEGPAFKEDKYNVGGHNIELVYLVVEELKELGYKVTLKTIVPGTESQIGKTNLIVEW